MKSNFQDYRKSYREELRSRGLDGMPPVVGMETGEERLHCLIPVRIIGIPHDPEHPDTPEQRLEKAALEHELSFGIETGEHNWEAVEEITSGQAPGGTQMLGINPATLIARISRAAGDWPVYCHIGRKLREYDGDELPERLRDRVYDGLYHAEMFRAQG